MIGLVKNMDASLGIYGASIYDALTIPPASNLAFYRFWCFPTSPAILPFGKRRHLPRIRFEVDLKPATPNSLVFVLFTLRGGASVNFSRSDYSLVFK